MDDQREIEEMLAPETLAIAIESEPNFSVDHQSLANVRDFPGFTSFVKHLQPDK